MVDSGLINHGWTYINIDDTWQGERGGKFHALQGNEKFPDMKALCDEIHALGLKFGIYSTPWMTSYAIYPGGSSDNPEGTWTKTMGNEPILAVWQIFFHQPTPTNGRRGALIISNMIGTRRRAARESHEPGPAQNPGATSSSASPTPRPLTTQPTGRDGRIAGAPPATS